MTSFSDTDQLIIKTLCQHLRRESYKTKIYFAKKFFFCIVTFCDKYIPIQCAFFTLQ